MFMRSRVKKFIPFRYSPHNAMGIAGPGLHLPKLSTLPGMYV